MEASDSCSSSVGGCDILTLCPTPGAVGGSGALIALRTTSASKDSITYRKTLFYHSLPYTFCDIS